MYDFLSSPTVNRLLITFQVRIKIQYPKGAKALRKASVARLVNLGFFRTSYEGRDVLALRYYLRSIYIYRVYKWSGQTSYS